MINLVTSYWLAENINNENIVILDCRFDLIDKEYSQRAFEKSHIKRAQRIDIETQLSNKEQEHGGRHPIPTTTELEGIFQKIGINQDSVVISYDEGDLAGASRLWWILKYLGHNEVYVLNGGITEFEKIGGEVTTEIKKLKTGDFVVNINESMKVDMEYVKERINNENTVIVDSREYKRYIGKFEPVDKKAGHIPNAKNYFWMNILKKENNIFNLKDKEELIRNFENLDLYEEIIIYCGSGITACANSLALSEIGIEHKVYCGSFSDWISYDDNEVETKEQVNK